MKKKAIPLTVAVVTMALASAPKAMAFESVPEPDFDEAEDFMNETEPDPLTQDILKYAATHLGKPYRWGATGTKAFDCSGFTSHVFKNFDITLNRTSRQQFLQGEKISRENIKPGDLMFFAGRNGGKTVSHVGLAVDVDPEGKVKFIHSASKQGVVYENLDTKYYSRRFLGARRVINNQEQNHDNREVN